MIRALSIAFSSLCIAGLFAGSASAQDSARASLSVQRALSVVAVRPIQLSPQQREATLTLSADIRPDAPAVIRVTGDPGRVYRIRVPENLTSPEGAALIENLRIWSDNSGDVSASRASRMDDQGRDLLRVTGFARSAPGATDGVATLPLSIDYE